MTELLLITDIPRLRKVFSHIADEPDIRMRVSTSLENGAMEIVAEKPAIVFVQTHLSGFSAEILLMHLKKQLGKKRCRFILLGAKELMNEDALKQYQGHIDTSQDDNQIFDEIMGTIDNHRHNKKNETANQLHPADELQNIFPEESPTEEQNSSQRVNRAMPANEDRKMLPAENAAADTSLEEQGVTYSARPQLSVYSEFTSSFDNAVSNMPSKEVSQRSEHWADFENDAIDIEPAHTRPKWVTLLLWAVPLLAVVIAFTMLQNRFSQPKPVDIAPALPQAGQIREAAPAPVAPAAPVAPVVPVAPAEKPISSQPAAIPDPVKQNAAKRLTRLPDFIPANNPDNNYSRSNPGWELYKGRKTDFKIYRENNTIKAIQLIDREGSGMSELFMFNILKQLVKNPKFTMESSEKKDGYEIRRGRLTEDIKMVQYLNAGSSKLRGFVLTWR